MTLLGSKNCSVPGSLDSRCSESCAKEYSRPGLQGALGFQEQSDSRIRTTECPVEPKPGPPLVTVFSASPALLAAPIMPKVRDRQDLCVCNPSPLEMERGGSEVDGRPHLCSKFKASLVSEEREERGERGRGNGRGKGKEVGGLCCVRQETKIAHV